MANEVPAISQFILRSAGLGQSIVVGAAMLFSGWILLARQWPDLLVPDLALGPELAAVLVWLGRGGVILLVLFTAALLGEMWLGVVRLFFRSLAIRKVQCNPSDSVGQGVFATASRDRFAAVAESAPEMKDLEADQEVECRRLIYRWVLEQANGPGSLTGAASLTYEQLRSEAELRAGLTLWGPLAIFIACLHLKNPPAPVFWVGVAVALLLGLALFLSARKRWLAANSYLLGALAGEVDWARFAHRAAGMREP